MKNAEAIVYIFTKTRCASKTFGFVRNLHKLLLNKLVTQSYTNLCKLLGLCETLCETHNNEC